MISAHFDYASPSALLAEEGRTLLGFTADARRPVRFNGRLIQQVPLVRFALRALGAAIWSRDDWSGDGAAGALDPVITVHPDRLFLEAFTGDESAYVSLLLDRRLFETEGEVRTGTTNVDFTAWLWGALGEMRSSRETWLRIDPAGFAVETKGAGGRFEPRVDVPETWIRGFLLTQAAMAMPGTRLSVRPVDLLAAIRHLQFTKAKLSPRALRYEFPPGRDACLVLEPWEKRIPLKGAEHGYTETRVIRTWGRRRLRLLEPLLPFAERVDVYLKGRGLPSFYAVKLPGMTFLLGLSGHSSQGWATSGGFGLPVNADPVEPALLDKVGRVLADRFTASEHELAAEFSESPARLHAALSRLCRLGRATYDVEARVFRHRELLPGPIDETAIYPPDPRSESAAAHVTAGAVQIESCQAQETRKERRLKTPEGPVLRTLVHRDWKVTGTVADAGPLEIVINDTGRILFGRCTCAFFQDKLLSQGPCEHMIALFRASEASRQDLPSSYASGGAELPGSLAKATKKQGRDEEQDEDEKATGDDEESLDEETEGEEK